MLSFIFFVIFVVHKIEEMNKRIAFTGILICLGAIYRLVPHPNNFTPVAAMALLGGFYFSKKYLAFLVPVLALLVSDFILNNTANRIFFEDHTGIVFWADYMTFTYSAIIATVIVGITLTNASKTAKIVGGSLASAVMFFLVTNFGSWLTTAIYPKNLGGLMASYTAGIPFFANTLISNLLFTAIFVFTIERAYTFSRKIVNV